MLSSSGYFKGIFLRFVLQLFSALSDNTNTSRINQGQKTWPAPKIRMLQGFSSERADYWTLSFPNDKQYEKNENSSM